MTRGLRGVVQAIVLALATTHALACGGEPEPDAEAAGPREATVTEPPRTALPDDTLVIAVRRLPEGLDPMAELDPWGQRVVDDLVFEGLTRIAGDDAPFVELALADDCVLTPAAAPKHAWCHLRPDVQFHDGSRVRPEDVLEAMSAWLDPRRDALRARHQLGELERVELVDRPPAAAGTHAEDRGKWVHVEVERADPLLLERLAAMKIWPKGKRRGGGFAKAPIGTGPMRVVAFEPDAIVLEGSGGARRSAAVRRIRLEASTDGSQTLVRLRRGDVHLALEIPPSFVPRELAKPGMAARFTAWLLTPPRFDLLFYNLRKGPLDAVALRAALDRAIPRVAIAATRDAMPPVAADAPVDLRAPVEIDLAGLHAAKAAAAWGAFGLPAPAPGEGDGPAMTAAAAALDALGWRIDRGVRRRGEGSLRLVLMWDGAGGTANATAAALRRAWQKLGVTVPQATASFAYLFGLMRQGSFDVAMLRLSTASDADLYPYFHRKGELNIAGVADDALDRALEGYRAATTRAARRSALAEVAARLSALRVASVLHAPSSLAIVSRRVQGLTFVDDLPQLDLLQLSAADRWPPAP
ncbi:MAG: hypothetical protein IPH07_05655 [Deltaproteobacteria bacterium]|nr:hypothetical protein [Deltaproteobacteria bacterium]MBK8719887.1 hypothetical protein [Deltaproteobacteria bacterium]MBP7290716.1 hypothetical protein [Nannocystaceae bacterium]